MFRTGLPEIEYALIFQKTFQRRYSIADRATKERKLVALMINDFESNLSESELVQLEEEVRSTPEEDLDRTLSGRLNLPYPVDPEALDRALQQVEQPERVSGEGAGGFTRAPDMSHEARPEEREG